MYLLEIAGVARQVEALCHTDSRAAPWKATFPDALL